MSGAPTGMPRAWPRWATLAGWVDTPPGGTMHDQLRPITPALGWQQRRSRIQVYFCCCPFILPLAPLFLAARLSQYGTLRLLGRPAASPWARRSEADA